MKFFKHIDEYYDFDDILHSISQSIGKYSGDTFSVRIEISEKVTHELNFPIQPIPGFVKMSRAGSADYKHYHYWEIIFDYYWTYSSSQANQYLIKKLRKGLEKVDSILYANKMPVMGLRTKNNLVYLNENRYKNRVYLHIEPSYLYTILDKYLPRTVDAGKRKEWEDDLSWNTIRKVGKQFENISIGYNKELQNFF